MDKNFWISPLTGFKAAGWAISWWIGALVLEIWFWDILEPTPFLLFFAVTGIVAARSGPIYGMLTAVVALFAVVLRHSDPSALMMPGLGMFVACVVISYLAHSARQATKLALAQEKSWAKEREKALETERALRAEAERASLTKDEFFATLSHELRAPLNAILGWATMIISGRIGGNDVIEAVKVIQRNARAQAQLVEDLLDLNRIIAGKLHLELQAVSVPDVIEAAIAALQPHFESKRLRLTKLVEPLIAPIQGDPARLQQVIGNLLSNAIKFTREGGKVAISLQRVDAHIELSVSDDGIGIAPDLLPHVFDRFSQATDSKRREGGLGLGLAICRHLVELHGGTIQAKSAGEGHGSTFRIILPVPIKSDSSEERAGQTHPSTTDLRPMAWSIPELKGLSVLLVEDNRDSRELLTSLLSEGGGKVIATASAEEALKVSETHIFNLVVSDLGLPGMDGLELVHILRTKPGGEKLLSIAVTAFARPEDRRRALLTGYDFFISKPLDPGELSAILHRCMARLEAIDSVSYRGKPNSVTPQRTRNGERQKDGGRAP